MLADLPHGVPIGEVGTKEGHFAREIIAACDPQPLHLFDIAFETLEWFHPEVAELAELHEGRSFETVSAMPDGYFGWLYIDADHTYPYVRNDIAVGAPKVAPDGLLVFNDYCLVSYLERGKPYGVVRAVNELVAEGEWFVRGFAFSVDGYHDIVLGRR